LYLYILSGNLSCCSGDPLQQKGSGNMNSASVSPERMVLLVGIVLVLTLLTELVRFAVYRKKIHFTCPKCQHVFKPRLGNFLCSGASNTASAGRMLTCPKCGVRSYMEPEKDCLS
jgi:rubredoxin